MSFHSPSTKPAPRTSCPLEGGDGTSGPELAEEALAHGCPRLAAPDAVTVMTAIGGREVPEHARTGRELLSEDRPPAADRPVAVWSKPVAYLLCIPGQGGCRG